MIAGRIENGKHFLDLRVYYEDTDFSGFVYHANYLKFCERARSDFIRLAGFDQTAMSAAGEHFVVHRMDCVFKSPARFDDIITVETTPSAVRGARMEMRQRVLRDGVELFAADVTAVIIDRKGRPIRVSAAMAEKFQLATKSAP
jgi:acyl-CoA thioester hydrolase